MPDRMTRTWGRFTLSETAIGSGGGTAVGDLLAAYATEVGISEFRGRTIGAVIGHVNFVKASAQTTLTPVVERIQIGIAVLPRATSGSVVPVAGVDSYRWMWYLDYPWQQEAREISAGGFRNLGVSIPFHIRAMRKLDIGETLLVKARSVLSALEFEMGGNVLLLG